MMNISILKYLPHRPPMQMVDTITHINDTSIVTEFLIPEDCIFLEKEYFTESGLIENMAQTCSAIVGQFFFGLEEDTKRVIGYISAIKKAEIFSLPKVLHTIRTEATLLSRYVDKGYSICAMDCGVYHQEKLLAQGQMNLFIKELDV